MMKHDERVLIFLCNVITKAYQSVRKETTDNSKTNMSKRLLGFDYINTFVSDIPSDLKNLTVHSFKTNFDCKIFLVIDNKNKITYQIRSESTLPTKYNKGPLREKEINFQKLPGYLKCILRVQNSCNNNSMYSQCSFFDSSTETDKSLEYYKDIMKGSGADNTYAHYIIAYKTEDYNVVSINMLYLNEYCNLLTNCEDLTKYIAPDMADITEESVIITENQTVKPQSTKDLVSIKNPPYKNTLPTLRKKNDEGAS